MAERRPLILDEDGRVRVLPPWDTVVGLPAATPAVSFYVEPIIADEQLVFDASGDLLCAIVQGG